MNIYLECCGNLRIVFDMKCLYAAVLSVMFVISIDSLLRNILANKKKHGCIIIKLTFLFPYPKKQIHKSALISLP
jgi:hypothetical protein